MPACLPASRINHLTLPPPMTDQVQELELSVDLKSLDKLLEFLACE
jgi:hypothetical protein